MVENVSMLPDELFLKNLEEDERKGRELNERAEVCEDCLYWHSSNKRVGQCRRYAPTPQKWPHTERDDWCGEYVEA
jgi:hypothetical protein